MVRVHSAWRSPALRDVSFKVISYPHVFVCVNHRRKIGRREWPWQLAKNAKTKKAEGMAAVKEDTPKRAPKCAKPKPKKAARDSNKRKYDSSESTVPSHKRSKPAARYICDEGTPPEELSASQLLNLEEKLPRERGSKATGARALIEAAYHDV
ncbi:hypothetical protein PHYPSEUDO_001363 [Phytophthora pseudosyringae]|uniref:Uncharacterized protein n=1 Tax=Phytophthora pseudosyringae TaxID=221518 RepID=A0A8T1WKK3_9STRA|nr:hypothetical protein PHYPSEUDO_001363 [Phytophthora pseudosyringae]